MFDPTWIALDGSSRAEIFRRPLYSALQARGSRACTALLILIIRKFTRSHVRSHVDRTRWILESGDLPSPFVQRASSARVEGMHSTLDLDHSQIHALPCSIPRGSHSMDPRERRSSVALCTARFKRAGRGHAQHS